MSDLKTKKTIAELKVSKLREDIDRMLDSIEEQKCNDPDCTGYYRLVEDYDERKSLVDGGCCCHISPPCSFCTTSVSVCNICGDLITETH